MTRFYLTDNQMISYDMVLVQRWNYVTSTQYHL